jgi:hypothetical protein
MHFEENQLSPRSIGISPLPTPHPSCLQPTPVRSSTRCYPRFNLDMGRSRGFGSNASDYGQRPRHILTRFRCAYGNLSLKLARYVNSQAHSAKGTPSHIHSKLCIVLRLIVGDAISGTISLPSRGAFHLSLTVLLRYRWQRVFSLRRWSSQIPAGFLVSRGTWVPETSQMLFGYGAITRYGSAFQRICLNTWLVTRRHRQIRRSGPTTPIEQRLPLSHSIGLGYCAFARRYLRNRYCFLFVRLLRCFSSPAAL